MMNYKLKKNYALVQVDCDFEWNDKEVSLKLLRQLKDIFDENKIKATWFVVGHDLGISRYKDFCSGLIKNGHEIGNHSMSHKRNFHLLSYPEKTKEIVQCHKMIEKLGYNPVGFRTPYFAWDISVMHILNDLKYRYDSSVFPCPIYPLINSMKNALNRNLFDRNQLYRNHCIYNPIIRYMNSCVAEIPISVSLKLKLPLHASYSLTLPYIIAQKYTYSQFSKYMKNNSPLVYVIHLNDICPPQYLNSREFKFFIPYQERIKFIKWACYKIAQDFETIPTGDYVKLF